MARQLRKKSGTGIYHVMVRGINRQDIFEDEEDYLQMVSILRALSDRHDEQGLRLPPLEIYKTLKSHQGDPLPDKLHDKVADKVANKSAQKVMMLLNENGHLTREELAERIGLSLGGIKKIINSLRENGFIERVGSNKTGYWKVIRV